MRVFLTGFMGSGKSYLGQRLAARQGLPFIDLDVFVEQREGMPITQIFEEKGEDHFREVESRVLRSLHRLPMFVMATGGGAPCFHRNMDWMNRYGTTIFIDPTVDIIVRRLRNERDKRPLLQGDEDLADMVTAKLEARRTCYEMAAFHVQQTNPKQDLVRLILKYLKQLDPTSSHD